MIYTLISTTQRPRVSDKASRRLCLMPFSGVLCVVQVCEYGPHFQVRSSRTTLTIPAQLAAESSCLLPPVSGGARGAARLHQGHLPLPPGVRPGGMVQAERAVRRPAARRPLPAPDRAALAAHAGCRLRLRLRGASQWAPTFTQDAHRADLARIPCCRYLHDMWQAGYFLKRPCPGPLYAWLDYRPNQPHNGRKKVAGDYLVRPSIHPAMSLPTLECEITPLFHYCHAFRCTTAKARW